MKLNVSIPELPAIRHDYEVFKPEEDFGRSIDICNFNRYRILEETNKVELSKRGGDIFLSNNIRQNAITSKILFKKNALVGPVVTIDKFKNHEETIRKNKNLILRRPPEGPYLKRDSVSKPQGAYHLKTEGDFYHILPIALDEDTIKKFYVPPKKRKKQVLLHHHPSKIISQFKPPKYLDLERLEEELDEIGYELKAVKLSSYHSFLRELARSRYYLHPSPIDGFSYSQLQSYILGVPVIGIETPYNKYFNRRKYGDLIVDIEEDMGEVFRDLMYRQKLSLNSPLVEPMIEKIKEADKQYKSYEVSAQKWGAKYNKETWLDRFLEVAYNQIS